MDPRVLGPGLAPTPFTAEEIRAGCPVGRTIDLLVESAGAAPYVRYNRFVACDETGATIERGRRSGDAEVESTRARSSWAELQAHAAFPATATTIEPETIAIPLGTVDCLRYTVRDGDDMTVFWFAPAFPGMPVRVSSPADDSTTTMIASEV